MDEMPDALDFSNFVMEEFPIYTNSILKKIALNLSVYWGCIYVAKTVDENGSLSFRETSETG